MLSNSFACASESPSLLGSDIIILNRVGNITYVLSVFLAFSSPSAAALTSRRYSSVSTPSTRISPRSPATSETTPSSSAADIAFASTDGEIMLSVTSVLPSGSLPVSMPSYKNSTVVCATSSLL